MKCKYYPGKSCDGDRCYSCDAKSEAKVDRSHPQSRHLEVGDYTADQTAGWKGPDPRGCPPPETGTDRRRAILREVEGCVCRDRQNLYSDAEDNFADIAAILNVMWSKKLKEPLASEDVAIFDIAQKMARIKTSPDHLDNWIDGAGYFVCGAGIIKSRVA